MLASRSRHGCYRSAISRPILTAPPPLAQYLLRRPLSISEDRAEGDDGDGSGGGDGDGNDGGRGSADSGPRDSEDGDGSDGEEGGGKVVHELKKRLPFMLSYRYTGVLRS